MNTGTHGLIGMTLFAAGLVVGLGRYWSMKLCAERGWDKRRRLHLLVLFLPILLASLLLDDFIPHCPWWWTLVLFGFAVLAGSFAHWLRQRYLAHWLAGFASRDSRTHQAEVLLEPLARCLAIPSPPVYRIPGEEPLALTVGSLRPILYLSGYYLDSLSQEELCAVLAHELAHVSRRDNLVAIWASGLARIGYLVPQVRESHRAMLMERELAADELAVALTGHPLILAQVLLQIALARTESNDQPHPACGFDNAADLQHRIERLMELHRAGGSFATIQMRREHPDWRSAGQWLVVIALAVICTDVLPFSLRLP